MPVASLPMQGRIRGRFSHLGIRGGIAVTACCLAPLTDVKLGPVQLCEIFLLLGMFVLSPRFLRAPLSIAGTRPYNYMAGFICVCGVSALLAYFREHFFVPADTTSLLKQPGWISAARLAQLALVFFSFSVVFAACGSRQQTRRRCVAAYIVSAAASAVYGTFSFALASVGVMVGGAYGDDGLRLKAFFVEGGPYGLFCGSALLLLACEWNDRSSLTRRWRTPIASILILSLALAQSKAASSALVAVLLLGVVFNGLRSILKYWPLIVAATAIVAASMVIGGAEGYVARTLERKDAVLQSAEMFADDYNVVMGRIAGMIIVPEMIASHPLLGIGIGNYSLLRNSGEYNFHLPAVDLWDLPGLGLYGLVAETGVLGIIPLCLFFVWPIRVARRSRQPYLRTALAAYPLAALLFGVQPTFLYPWLIAAISLSLSLSQSTAQDDGTAKKARLRGRQFRANGAGSIDA